MRAPFVAAVWGLARQAEGFLLVFGEVVEVGEFFVDGSSDEGAEVFASGLAHPFEEADVLVGHSHADHSHYFHVKLN
jgi:hypothetical protein